MLLLVLIDEDVLIHVVTMYINFSGFSSTSGLNICGGERKITSVLK